MLSPQEFPAEKLLQCSRCQVAFYCCAEHQLNDYPRHRTLCHNVYNARQVLVASETQLWHYREQDRAYPQGEAAEGTEDTAKGVEKSDHTEEPEAVEDDEGDVLRFEDIDDMYLLCKRKYVRSLAAVGTHTAVSLAYEEAMDLIRLVQSDDVGAGLPVIMLLLGKWQEAYNFMKRRLGVPEGSTSSPSHRQIPVFPTDDITEPINPFRECYCYFTMAALTRIKVEMAGRVKEVIDAYASSAPTSTDLLALLSGRRSEEPRDLEGWQQLYDELMRQARAAFKHTQCLNPEFWRTILKPERVKNLSTYTHGWQLRGAMKPWLEPNVMLWRDSLAFIEGEWKLLTPSEQKWGE